MSEIVSLKRNKTGTSKVGAISKAQKAQVFKIVKGGPFGLVENPVCCKISKKLKGGPFEGKRIFEKKFAQCRKKLKEGTLQCPPHSQMLEKVSDQSRDWNS